ncbi:SDR family NAD(P)-dependent oxidoreductase [Aureimonas sp. AU40]|uniref:SDR family NAD(P)-dependent oxidoreductase n=1 Tax=Aureimonas sp. AU40 TaxID=1637747 RepID=UPI0007830A0F|nr:SDR family oxidoreductase [Aureimonas sp. AU40]
MERAIYPSLRGRSVFVTGGASGIGAEIVGAFAEQEARVGFVDIDGAAGEALATRWREAGAEVRFERCDVTDIEGLRSGFASLAATLGPAEILVNNAALDDRHDWREVTPERYDRLSAVNLRHLFFAIQAVAPGMIARGGGAIVNMGSASWMEGVGGMPVYTSAKAGIHGLTRSFARDLGPHRIRVNTVVPSWVMTERQLTLWASPEGLEAHRARQCLPDLNTPAFVAAMVLFLASDNAAMCTAGWYPVDAGSI